VETRLRGLIAQPITLSGYYSQTYHPFHHNFAEEFVFEPGLEPGLPVEQLLALRAANIRLVYALRGFEGDQIKILGWDGKFR